MIGIGISIRDYRSTSLVQPGIGPLSRLRDVNQRCQRVDTSYPNGLTVFSLRSSSDALSNQPSVVIEELLETRGPRDAHSGFELGGDRVENPAVEVRDVEGEIGTTVGEEDVDWMADVGFVGPGDQRCILLVR